MVLEGKRRDIRNIDMEPKSGRMTERIARSKTKVTPVKVQTREGTERSTFLGTFQGRFLL